MISGRRSRVWGGDRVIYDKREEDQEKREEASEVDSVGDGDV